MSAVRINLKEHPHIAKLMSAEDQKRFGFVDPGIHPPYAEDHHAPVQTGRLEREEQRQFANWLLLNGYKARVWHATHKATTANPGVCDFIVPIWGGTLWIEFKLPGAKLSEAQEEFRAGLEAKGHQLYVCYSAGEAIALVKQKDQLL
jgi:VRR-NUC domain